MLAIVIALIIFTSRGSCTSLIQYSQNDYIVVSERFELMDYNESYISKPIIKNFKLNRTHFAINVSATWKINLHGVVTVTTQAYKFVSNEYRLFPVYFPFDLCDVLTRNIFGLDTLYECGHMFRCPIKKGPFTICNWFPDFTQFPPHAPRGRYKINVETMNSGIIMTKHNWYFEIKDVPLPY